MTVKYDTKRPEKSFHLTPSMIQSMKDKGKDLGCIENYKGMTMFLRLEEDGFWYGAIAKCSKNDNFDRKAGFSVARRRYFTRRQDTMSWYKSGDHGMDPQTLNHTINQSNDPVVLADAPDGFHDIVMKMFHDSAV